MSAWDGGRPSGRSPPALAIRPLSSVTRQPAFFSCVLKLSNLKGSARLSVARSLMTPGANGAAGFSRAAAARASQALGSPAANEGCFLSSRPSQPSREAAPGASAAAAAAPCRSSTMTRSRPHEPHTRAEIAHPGLGLREGKRRSHAGLERASDARLEIAPRIRIGRHRQRGCEQGRIGLLVAKIAASRRARRRGSTGRDGWRPEPRGARRRSWRMPARAARAPPSAQSSGIRRRRD